MRCNHRSLRGGVLAVAVALSPAAALAQYTPFAAVGGGASFPTGRSSIGMNPGWVAEAMAGIVLPGDIASVRVGATYARHRVDATTVGSGSMFGTTGGGTDTMLGLMAGLMLMPTWDSDFTPYVHAGAGVMRGKYQETLTSFAWQSGVGVTYQTGAIGFYIDSRFVQARTVPGLGQMVPVTAGIRIGG